MRRADMAVYAAKRAGRNRVMVATADEADVIGAASRIVSDEHMIQSLRTAIRRVGRTMDRATVGAYDAGAAGFAKDWHDQPAPVDLHALVKRFFRPGRTADIGCGSGREVAFLAANGFDAVGYDASDALLEQARLRYPRLQFATAALPGLAGVPDAAFDNVLCETVIMHLRRPQILDACAACSPSQTRRNSLSELARHRRRRPA